jgi:pilus assembly protein Flp/PilA
VRLRWEEVKSMEKLSEKLLEGYAQVRTLAVQARTLVARQEGQGMVEYALILFLVSIAAIAFLTAIGVDVKNVFNQVDDKLGNTAT